LNYLKRFPIDTIKIDRSFVMEIPGNADDVAITAAVISMAHRLNLVVVAEGVETAEQLAFLAEHECEYGQGYYFARPLPLPIEAFSIERCHAAPYKRPTRNWL
jgi:EAL domain-containing protein (putative c-di-GMP-specific phosphodiesterase class I)